MDFSRAEASLIATRGRATSMSFFRSVSGLANSFFSEDFFPERCARPTYRPPSLCARVRLMRPACLASARLSRVSDSLQPSNASMRVVCVVA